MWALSGFVGNEEACEDNDWYVFGCIHQIPRKSIISVSPDALCKSNPERYKHNDGVICHQPRTVLYILRCRYCRVSPETIEEETACSTQILEWINETCEDISHNEMLESDYCEWWHENFNKHFEHFESRCQIESVKWDQAHCHHHNEGSKCKCSYRYRE